MWLGGREVSLLGVRVLVVDDDPDISEALEIYLTSYGAEVRRAESAGAGLRAVVEFHPDVLVSDIAMPNEDGCAFIARVRALGPEDGGDVPAIALTAYPQYRDRALRAGFQRLLSKPVDPATVLQTVRALAPQPAKVTQTAG